MKRKRNRKCKHCKELFSADKRNVSRQKYCSKSECRKASKADSQRRWLAKPENQNYFRGPDNVQRVKEWRKAHPGYWHRKGPERANALQDSLDEKSKQKQSSTDIFLLDALQDALKAQPLVLLGLIANLTGSTLPDDITLTAQRLRQLGDDILNTPTLRKGAQHGIQSPPSISPTAETYAKTVQLGGSPSGP